VKRRHRIIVITYARFRFDSRTIQISNSPVPVFPSYLFFAESPKLVDAFHGHTRNSITYNLVRRLPFPYNRQYDCVRLRPVSLRKPDDLFLTLFRFIRTRHITDDVGRLYCFPTRFGLHRRNGNTVRWRKSKNRASGRIYAVVKRPSRL